jgi:hypothetical protein
MTQTPTGLEDAVGFGRPVGVRSSRRGLNDDANPDRVWTTNSKLFHTLNA